MKSRGQGLLNAAAVLAALACPAAAFAQQGTPESKLERAKEEGGVAGTPRSRFDLGGAELRITPNELVAATYGQKLRFTVQVERRVDDARLVVTLPRRWLGRGPGGLAASRPARMDRSAGGRARLGGSRGEVVLQFEDAGAGSVASFEVTDLGIPASRYRLPFRWEGPGRSEAGSAEVIFYKPAREATPANPWAGVRAVDVSADAVIEESETFSAVNPADSDRAAVGSNWSATSMPAWISNNAFASRTQISLPTLTDVRTPGADENSDVCCDPMFAADDLGNIWYGGLTLRVPANTALPATAPSRIIVNRIAGPSGTSFQAKNVGLDFLVDSIQDKPLMTIDNGPSSPNKGRLYVVWDGPNAGVDILISECDTIQGGSSAADCDSPNNWSPPARVTPVPGSYIYPDVEVGPDGKVYVTWWDFSNVNAIRGLVCSANCDTETAWPNTPSTIATLDSSFSRPVPFACPIRAQPGGRASPAPQLDVDHSGGPNSGRVYVTWSDLRPGSGTTKCDDTTPPALTHLSFDNFVASAGAALPGGAQPSATVGTRLLTDGATSADDWFTWLSVDQSTGQAYADFYSTSHDSTRRAAHFYLRAVTPSGTGGHSLGRLVQISSAPSDYSSEPCCGFGNDYGDYEGVDAGGGVVWPVWTDTTTGDGDVFSVTPSLSFATQNALASEGAGADGDGFVEGGEPVLVTHTLANTSTVTGTGISGTLTPNTAGGTVQQGSASYPNLRPTLFGPATATFQVTLPSGLGCNAPVDFDVGLSATQQNTGAVVSRTAPLTVTTTCAGAAPPPPPPAGPPPPPPVGPPAPPPPAGPLRLQLSVATASRRSFDTAFFNGVRVSARCNRDCKLDARLLLDRRTAKRLKLKQQVSRRRSSLTRAGTRRLVLTIPKTVQRKLRTLRSVKLTLRVVGTAGTVRRTASRTITLKR